MVIYQMAAILYTLFLLAVMGVAVYLLVLVIKALN